MVIFANFWTICHSAFRSISIVFPPLIFIIMFFNSSSKLRENHITLQILPLVSSMVSTPAPSLKILKIFLPPLFKGPFYHVSPLSPLFLEQKSLFLYSLIYWHLWSYSKLQISLNFLTLKRYGILLKNILKCKVQYRA